MDGQEILYQDVTHHITKCFFFFETIIKKLTHFFIKQHFNVSQSAAKFPQMIYTTLFGVCNTCLIQSSTHHVSQLLLFCFQRSIFLFYFSLFYLLSVRNDFFVPGSSLFCMHHFVDTWLVVHSIGNHPKSTRTHPCHVSLLQINLCKCFSTLHASLCQHVASCTFNRYHPS